MAVNIKDIAKYLLNCHAPVLFPGFSLRLRALAQQYVRRIMNPDLPIFVKCLIADARTFAAFVVLTQICQFFSFSNSNPSFDLYIFLMAFSSSPNGFTGIRSITSGADMPDSKSVVSDPATISDMLYSASA